MKTFIQCCMRVSVMLISFLFMLCFTQRSFGQGTQTFNASGTFNVPIGVTQITVSCWGGGGAGGGSTNAGSGVARGGGGGGGGAFASRTITVSPGTLSVVVAALVTGNLGATGTNGQNSTITGFESLILAAGGTGGTGNITGGSPGGGAGGSLAVSKGSTVTAGVNGAAGATGLGISPGVGGAGANGGGTGGTVVNSGSANGGNGNALGGGGGGSRTSQNDGTRTGGSGAAGRVVITWVCPTATISYAGNPFCKSVTNAAVSLTGGTGGAFSAPGGLSINPSTGSINPSASTTGTYLVHYQIAADRGCPAIDATTSVTISPTPTTSSTQSNISCFGVGDGSITVTGSGAAGSYTFSKDNGDNYEAGSNPHTFSGLTPGIYKIRVKSAAGCESIELP